MLSPTNTNLQRGPYLKIESRILNEAILSSWWATGVVLASRGLFIRVAFCFCRLTDLVAFLEIKDLVAFLEVIETWTICVVLRGLERN